MKFFILGLIAALLSFSVSFSAVADNHLVAEEAVLSKLMQAISQNDYEAFISNGTSQFKSGITKKIFDAVENQVGSLIRGGYQAAYLAQLNQQGNKVHLWKITYAASKENTLAKLVITENKVAGFWLQ